MMGKRLTDKCDYFLCLNPLQETVLKATCKFFLPNLIANGIHNLFLKSHCRFLRPVSEYSFDGCIPINASSLAQAELYESFVCCQEDVRGITLNLVFPLGLTQMKTYRPNLWRKLEPLHGNLFQSLLRQQRCFRSLLGICNKFLLSRVHYRVDRSIPI